MTVRVQNRKMPQSRLQIQSFEFTFRKLLFGLNKRPPSANFVTPNFMSDMVPNERKRCLAIQWTRYSETIKQVLNGIEKGESGDGQGIPGVLAQVVDKIEAQQTKWQAEPDE
ncbi:hypothetical protein PTI98_004207 [Pleurotus ostreatus]|nr:hypothetical protein PTI98_004207 [Pleurotus ostreatus]